MLVSSSAYIYCSLKSAIGATFVQLNSVLNLFYLFILSNVTLKSSANYYFSLFKSFNSPQDSGFSLKRFLVLLFLTLKPTFTIYLGSLEFV